MEFKVKKGNFTQLGVTGGKTWANFCLECRKESDCKIRLYQRDGKSLSGEIAIPLEFSKGNLRSVRVDGLDLLEYDYNFWIDGKEACDPYAKRIAGREAWADASRFEKDGAILRCRHDANVFSWRGDCEVFIPRKDMVIYKLHVRGFTKGLPGESREKGTFLGLTKKLSYLKSLGITTIELMPVYEFEELVPKGIEWKFQKKDKIKKPEGKQLYKINCWGYGEGMYYAPKASYAAGENPAAELKNCILQMHKKGMECILEMDFPKSVPGGRILPILKYWVMEYHVDGFHLQGDGIPIEELADDPYLGRTKLFYKDILECFVPDEEKSYPRIFLDNDEFLYPCRKLACSHDGNVWELTDQMKKQNEKLGYINYIADNNGFTLKDLFAYERKHNEANGEGNIDGPAWNFSINCGVEGETSSRNVQRIRIRRMKNAIAMLFLSQGVPMLMAGDEDGNSQQGNNNAYCQDNEIGWKDWKNSRADKDFLKYVRQMIRFRKEHQILRMEGPMALSDTQGIGQPALSYHEENAWITSQYCNRKVIGIFYCGAYEKEKEDIYLGFNFSDFPKKLALPKQGAKRNWYLFMDTAGRTSFLQEPEKLAEPFYVLDAQSICIMIGK